MTYTLYFGSTLAWSYFKRIVKNEMDTIIKVEIVKENEKELDISCDFFTLYINNWIEGIGFACEDYELDLKYQLWFDLLSSVEGSTEMMLNVIGRILKQISGDALLMWNGELPIMERRSGVITVDDKMSDPQGPPYPFDQMNVQYQKGYLKP